MFKQALRTCAKSTLTIVLVCFTASTFSQESKTNSLLEYTHAGKAYPPVFFVSNIEDKRFTQKLEEFKAFSLLDEKAVGIPIGLRILKGHRTKQDGTQFSSLMLSASTLGIIPVVSNTEFKVRYDVFVQGKSIANYEYTMDSTDVNNFWTAAYREYETKPSEQQFLEATLARFLNEIKTNKEVQGVFTEYYDYFE